MFRSAILAAAILLLVAAQTPAQSQEIGDPVRGQTYAQENCDECHAIGPDEGLSPNVDAPSFKTIANTPGMSPRALNVWFKSPHPTMPNLIIPAEDADNVIAYLMGLKD